MHIGPHQLRNRLLVAPMAGVTDRPFRQLCKTLGAGYAVSEMVASDARLWDTTKSRRRRDHVGEVDPIAVQIAGTDPAMMAAAAQFNVDQGAQIIDINMGCPAKKVCNVYAGSALLRDEPLVAKILDAVVNAVCVPVTLKIRTGWNAQNKNALRIAQLAQDGGIQALVIHGRTRSDLYNGAAEYDTIAEVKASIRIPVIANGDIDCPEKAAFVLNKTGADAIMIGRAAQGRPWIFREIDHYLRTGTALPPPDAAEIKDILLTHLRGLYAFYGEATGVRVARKHVGWYARSIPGGDSLRSQINALDRIDTQLECIEQYFHAFVHKRSTTKQVMHGEELEL